MSQELFRKEVIKERLNSHLGKISLTQSLHIWVLTTAAVVVAIVVCLFLAFAGYTRRSRVVGELIPAEGLATVLSPATGVAGRIDVSEGATVRPGQMLALVAVPRATLAEGDTTTALEERLARRQKGLLSARSAQQQLLLVQEHGLREQLSAAQREQAQVEAEIETRQQQIRIAEETLGKLRELEDKKYVSRLQIKQQESAALEQVGEMQALQRDAMATRRNIAQLQQAISELPSQRETTSARFSRDLAALEEEQVETAAQGEMVIRAPVGGVVAAQLVKTGQPVEAGQPMLTLIPSNGKLEAQLLVPSRAIGFIEPGDKVLLRYQAYPYQKFGHQDGRVAQISRSALRPFELTALVGSPQPREPLYRVTVALSRQSITAYGKEEPLRPGMLLDADILGEQRPLLEWIFEPLYSIKGRVFDQ